ncbi:MAG: uracil-DNA glycosylase family protein [Bacteroidota bacterium]
MEDLLKEIKACTICKEHLPFAPKPIIRASARSKILIIGQAPGQKVQNSGIPWDDASGKELRSWLNVTSDQFYDTSIFAIMPMGMCYPGTGKSGDLPPRKECATAWHEKVLAKIPNIQLTLLIGKYAQDYYLGKLVKENLTETVRNYKEYLPNYLPLPHPSPRNNIWKKKNEWFAHDILPILNFRVHEILKNKY